MTPSAATLPTTPDGRHLLNLGCGGVFHEQWVNLDQHPAAASVLRWQDSSGIPFADATFDAVYHSHFLEHLTDQRAVRMLLECFRVLRPGGLIRVVVPDLEYNARLYLQCLDQVRESDRPLEREHYDWARLNLVDQMSRTSIGGRLADFLSRPHHEDWNFVVQTTGGSDASEYRRPGSDARRTRDAFALLTRPRRAAAVVRRKLIATAVGVMVGADARDAAMTARTGELHRSVYDEFSLRRLFAEVGFVSVSFHGPRDSHIAGFDAFQLDTTPSGEVRRPNSLFAEATKPQDE